MPQSRSLIQDFRKAQSVNVDANIAIKKVIEPKLSTIKIDFEDVNDEITYWEHAIVCYVIGANLPF